MSAFQIITEGPFFWSTPLGLFVSLSLFVCYGINVIHRGIDDCFFDRVYYSCVALVAFLAFIIGVDPTHQNPQSIGASILVMLAIRAWWRLIVRLVRFWRTKQPQSTLTSFSHKRGQSHVKTR